MTKIIITGKSASGKTTLSNYLEENYNYNIPFNYTTRKPRVENDKDYSEYRFVSKEFFNWLKKEGRLLNCTTFNGNEYGTGTELYGDDIVFVVDDNGRQDLLNFFPDAITVWVNIDSLTRRKRLFERGLRGDELEARMDGPSEQMSPTQNCIIVDGEKPVKESADLIISIIKEKQGV